MPSEEASLSAFNYDSVVVKNWKFEERCVFGIEKSMCVFFRWVFPCMVASSVQLRGIYVSDIFEVDCVS